MEAGKVIQRVQKNKVHRVVSVKPFGCMPSSGVSDGIQSLITQRYPELIFLPIETTGDGAVNVQSRIQMMLFRARQRAQAELDGALKDKGLTAEQARVRIEGSRRWRRPLAWPRHLAIGTAASVVGEVG